MEQLDGSSELFDLSLSHDQCFSLVFLCRAEERGSGSEHQPRLWDADPAAAAQIHRHRPPLAPPRRPQRWEGRKDGGRGGGGR